MRTEDATELLYARQSIVTHAKAYQLQAIDLVHIDFKSMIIGDYCTNVSSSLERCPDFKSCNCTVQSWGSYFMKVIYYILLVTFTKK